MGYRAGLAKLARRVYGVSVLDVMGVAGSICVVGESGGDPGR